MGYGRIHGTLMYAAQILFKRQRTHISMKYVYVVLLMAMAVLIPYGSAAAEIPAVQVIRPDILTLTLMVGGDVFESTAIAYPPSVDTVVGSMMVAGKGTVADTADITGDILLVEFVPSDSLPIQQMAWRAYAAGIDAIVLFGEDAPTYWEGDSGPPIPVIHTTDGSDLRSYIESNPDQKASITFGLHNFVALDGVGDVDAMTYDGKTFAVAVAGSALQVMDISSPHTPLAISHIPGEAGPNSEVRITNISGLPYALTSHGTELFIWNMSDPYNPSLTASMSDDIGGFDAIQDAGDIEIMHHAGSIFALVSSITDDGLQVIEITQPDSPRPVATIYDETSGFEALAGARGIEVANISGRLYALVAGYNDDAIQVVDMVNPHRPLALSVIGNSSDPWRLDGVIDVEVVFTDEDAFAVAASYNDNALQIVNITTPEMPLPERVISDDSGRFESLGGPWDIAVVETSGSQFGIISGYRDNSIQIIDLRDPSLVRATSIIPDYDDEDTDHVMYGPRGVREVDIDGNSYVLVAGYAEDTIHILDIDRPASPDMIGEAEADADIVLSLEAGGGLETVYIQNGTYVVVGSHTKDAIQLINMTNPFSPVPLQTIHDDDIEDTTLDGTSDIEVMKINDGYYVLATAYEDGGIQILNITDPSSIQLITDINNETASNAPLNGARGLDTTLIAGRPYILATSHLENAVQIVEMTNPLFPLMTHTIVHQAEYVQDSDIGHENVKTIHGLEGAWDVETFSMGGRTYGMVSSLHDDILEVYDITNPVSPWPLDIKYDEAAGFEYMDGPVDIEPFIIDGTMHAAVAAKWSGAITLLDMSNPASPVPVSHMVDNKNGFSGLGGVNDMEFVRLFGKTFIVAVSILDDAVQIIDVSEPDRPRPVGVLYDNSKLALDSASDVTIVEQGRRVYALVASVTEQAIQMLDITDVWKN